MISSGSFPTKYSFTKNLVSDQTYVDIREIYTTASGAFDVSNGYGVGSGTSSVGFIVLAGGFADQTVTGVVRAVNTTDRLGIFGRATQTDSGTEYYYYANIDSGTARLSKYVNGTLTTMSSSAFTFAAATDVTIVLSCVGASISATFTSSGVAQSPLTLSSAEDSNVPRRGTFGFRTHLKPGWCRSFTVAQP